MQQVLTYINEHRQTLFEQWYSLAQRLAVAAHPNQPALLIELFKEQHIHLRPLEGHPSVLYGELLTGSSLTAHTFTLLLWSQHNAFFTKTHQWNTLAMRLLALQLHQDIYESFPLRILWIIEIGNEQNGSSIYSPFSIMEHNQLFPQVDGCICDLSTPSAIPVMALGTKGSLRVSLEADTSQTSMSSLYGSILPDAAWQLVWCLNSLKDMREELLIEHFYDTLTPPDDEVIALLANSSLAGFPFEQDGHKALFGLQGLQARYAAQFLPSCTITFMNSSTPSDDTAYKSQEQQPVIIPAHSHALLDFYLVPDQQPQDIFSKLQKHITAHGFQDISLRLLSSTPTIHTPFRNSFIQTIHSATIQVQANEHLYAEALTMIPFATESTFSSSLLPPTTMPFIFNQFGLLDNNKRFDTQIQSTYFAHLAHFCVFLEGFRHATTTTC